MGVEAIGYSWAPSRAAVSSTEICPGRRLQPKNEQSALKLGNRHAKTRTGLSGSSSFDWLVYGARTLLSVHSRVP